MEYHGESSSQVAIPEHSALPPTPPISPLSAYAPLSRSASEQRAVASSSLMRAPPPARPPPPPMVRRSSSDLFDWVERQEHFSEAPARYIFHQLANTACDLASVGVLHRDWKDENITTDEKLTVRRRSFPSHSLARAAS